MKHLVIGLSLASLTAGPVSASSIDDAAATQLAWIEDEALRAQVVDYAKAGQPDLSQLTSDQGLDLVRLPKRVLSDIIDMNAHRFVADSDYDQRITKLYVFRHHGGFDDLGCHDELAAVAETLAIPASLVGSVAYRRYDAHDRSFLGEYFDSLYIGGVFVEHTSLKSFLRQTLRGEEVRVFTFGPEEISLYPGGGFSVRFYLFVTDELLIYAKREGWNS